MVSLLIFIIYLSFISLGLPDSLLGSAWPTLRIELNVPLSTVGIVSMIITMSTIVSSLLSDKLITTFSSKVVTAFSILLTSVAMFLFSISNEFVELCLIAIPYGLGAGCIDACLNNYVALHLKASHMSFLHCMWGVGATISPIIMSFALNHLNNWRMGYRIVSIVQFIIFLVVLFSFPLWKKDEKDNKEEKPVSISIAEVFRIEGAVYMLLGFNLYCAIEGINFVWIASYFSIEHGIDASKVATFGGLFYTGMMIGRALNGFIADKYEDQQLIKVGGIIMILTNAMIYFSSSSTLCAIGFLISGIGAGPLYPSIIHETPKRFDSRYCQSIIGVQMAVAYVGSSLSPYCFGLLAEHVNINLLPLCVLILCVLSMLSLRIYHKKTVYRK